MTIFANFILRYIIFDSDREVRKNRREGHDWTLRNKISNFKIYESNAERCDRNHDYKAKEKLIVSL